jgi:hypothetical protein
LYDGLVLRETLAALALLQDGAPARTGGVTWMTGSDNSKLSDDEVAALVACPYSLKGR